ncbi:phosphohydrolase [Rubricoccus marinus]|uniref:Phosphohydrolase n=1 Tax=Rubricoccus marinus TaxID=716817 RepID=A0A259U246_9BACT|nr:phosphohydrolase [Rubricoccus marinus]
MPLHSPSRSKRRWRLVARGVFALLTVLALWAFAFEPASLRVRETALTLERWPSELDGLRVAVLADLHTGSPWNGTKSLARVVRETNDARPDLVLIAGDLVIQGVVGGRFVSPEVSGEILSGLEARLGVFAVLGNHDWWLDGPRVIRALEASGVTVLEDSSAAIPFRGDTLWLAGVSDYWEAPHDIGRALSAVPPTSAPLVFTHNPDVFPEMPRRVALTIAGHTHGGQVALPGVGRPIVPSVYGERYASGHVREYGRDLFVSTGVGTSILPVRFRVPPEVHVLTLRSPPR